MLTVLEKILEDLAQFYSATVPRRTFRIDVFVQSQKARSIRGIRKGHTIRIWRRKDESWRRLIAIIAHELGHAIEKQARSHIRVAMLLHLAAKGYRASHKECNEIIGEAILRTLVPNGHLAEKYGLRDSNGRPERIKSGGTNSIVKELKDRMMPLILTVLQREQNIFDDNYIGQIADMYLDIVTRRKPRAAHGSARSAVRNTSNPT